MCTSVTAQENKLVRKQCLKMIILTQLRTEKPQIYCLCQILLIILLRVTVSRSLRGNSDL